MSALPEASLRRSGRLVFLAGAGFAGMELIGQHLPPGYSVQQVVWTRYAVHLLALLALPGRGTEVWRTRRPVLQLLSSATMLAMPFCFVAGARALSAPVTWAVFWIAPAMALGLGALLVHEAPSLRTWGLAAFACLASALALAERPRGARVEWLWPVGMAACFALYLVLGRLLRTETTESKLFFVALGVFLALSPSVAGVFVVPDPFAMLILAAIGLVGLATLYAIDRAFERAPLADLAVFAFAAVPFTVLFEAVLTSSLGRRAAFGALLVALALAGQYRALPRDAGEERS